LRAGGPKNGHPESVSAMLFEDRVRRDRVSEMLAHLAPVGKDHIVSEVTSDGLGIVEKVLLVKHYAEKAVQMQVKESVEPTVQSIHGHPDVQL
jgi:hypothetical protein